MNRWIDVSVPLADGMTHWPGDPPFRRRVRLDMRRGDALTASAVACSSHAGTHMDAPAHFLRAGAGMDKMPLAATMGPARVIGIRDPREVGTGELKRCRVRRGERVLLRTNNSAKRWWDKPFREDFTAISEKGAAYLARRGVRCVGVDYLSVSGRRDDAVAVHRTLLKAGIWIIEGLDLTRVKPGRYELACLPLKIAGGEGAPARAALRRL